MSYSKSVVGNPISPPPRKENSHVKGWSIHWAETTGSTLHHKGDSWVGVDTLYFDHGVNFGGSLNLFGGLNDDVADAIIKFVDEFTGEIVSCDIQMPLYADMLSGRLGNATTSKRINQVILSEFGSILSKARTMTQLDLPTKGICIGDSHTAAYTKAGDAGFRTNGQTLFGALKPGALIDSCLSKLEGRDRVTLCFGSIDIRHHLCRQSDPSRAVRSLLVSLKDKVRQIRESGVDAVEVIVPVPVEYEDRKIPKTGFYKGTPFYGSREDRLSLTTLWADIVKSEFEHVVTCPEEWYKMDGEHFAKTKMEFGGSVHLSPLNYRRFNWGQQDKVISQLEFE